MGILDGQAAVVTGAGRGIGKGHALQLAKAGASVVVNDIDEAVAKALAAVPSEPYPRTAACKHEVTTMAGQDVPPPRGAR